MQRALLNTAVAVVLAGFSLAASAQFSGAYDPANWTVTHSPDGIVDQGSVLASTASVALTGSNSLSGDSSRISYTIVAPVAGTYSFDWQYVTSDNGDPGDQQLGTLPIPPSVFDWSGYVVDGSFVHLSTQGGASTQTGQMSLHLASGASFGFYVETVDNLAGSAMMTVSNFSAPVPEPASMLLMAMGLAGLALARKRRLD